MSDISKKLLNKGETIKLKLLSLKKELEVERNGITMWISGPMSETNIMLVGKVGKAFQQAGICGEDKEKEIEFKITLKPFKHGEGIGGSFVDSKKALARETLLEAIREHYKEQYRKLVS